MLSCLLTPSFFFSTLDQHESFTSHSDRIYLVVLCGHFSYLLWNSFPSRCDCRNWTRTSLYVALDICCVSLLFSSPPLFHLPTLVTINHTLIRWFFFQCQYTARIRFWRSPHEFQFDSYFATFDCFFFTCCISNTQAFYHCIYCEKWSTSIFLLLFKTPLLLFFVVFVSHAFFFATHRVWMQTNIFVDVVYYHFCLFNFPPFLNTFYSPPPPPKYNEWPLFYCRIQQLLLVWHLELS